MSRPSLGALLALGLAMGAAQEASAKGGRFGLGLGVAEDIVGLSMKYRYRPTYSFQGIIGAWDGGPRDGLVAMVDLVLEMPGQIDHEAIRLSWSLGPGVGLVVFDEDAGVLVSGALGGQLMIKPVPIDVVIEYRPRIYIGGVDDVDLVSFSGHIRYYF